MSANSKEARKSWAEQHDSSDEEDIGVHEDHDHSNANLQGKDVQSPVDEAVDVDTTTLDLPAEPKAYVFPSAPPFVAYVGGISFDVLEVTELADWLKDFSFHHLKLELEILECKLVKYPAHHAINQQENPPPHRGFGYVTVGSLEQLQHLMQLNDSPDALLRDRKVRVDVSIDRGESRHRGGGNDRGRERRDRDRPRASHGSFGDRDSSARIDGSAFRGGRYGGHDGGNRQPHGGIGGDMTDVNPNESLPAPADAPVRRALKLQPRTKPIEDTSTLVGTNSNIFGGAKPRDESSWMDKRQKDHDLKTPAAAPIAQKNSVTLAAPVVNSTAVVINETADNQADDSSGFTPVPSHQHHNQHSGGASRTNHWGTGRDGGRGRGGRGAGHGHGEGWGGGREVRSGPEVNSFSTGKSMTAITSSIPESHVAVKAGQESGRGHGGDRDARREAGRGRAERVDGGRGRGTERDEGREVGRSERADGRGGRGGRSAASGRSQSGGRNPKTHEGNKGTSNWRATKDHPQLAKDPTTSTPAVPAKRSQAPLVTESLKPRDEPKKTINKFEALGFDSDSE